MGKRRYRAEEIIPMLREAEVEIARGKTVEWVCKKLGVTEQTYYRWRKEYGGLRVEKENARLKGVVADQAIDIAILKEAARPNS